MVMEAELIDQSGKTRYKSTQEAIDELVNIFSSVSLLENENDLLRSNKRCTTTLEGTVACLDIENDEGVMATLVDKIIEEVGETNSPDGEIGVVETQEDDAYADSVFLLLFHLIQF